MSVNRVLAAIAICAGLGFAQAHAQEVRVLVQSSPLAGFRYHEAAEHLDAMHLGDPLALVREPLNPYDAQAIRVEWQGRKLGYVPRKENRTLAWLMDRGEPVHARISALRGEEPNPLRRIEFEVFLGEAPIARTEARTEAP